MQFEQQDNGHDGEFFTTNESGQKIAEISYVWNSPNQIVANHTWVDSSLRGQGIARKLLDTLVDFARKKDLKIVATCSYVDVMFKRDKSLADVVA